MDIRALDPRDTAWEQEHARYRVYFRDRAAVTAREYEVLDEADVDELLTWVSVYAAGRGRGDTLYVSTTGGDSPGLIRLAGVRGDPFADA
ncbi:hypothetical protein P8A22_20665 [Streptomyces laculatispora]|uniref:GNAT family N-acetyltransferase n=1 Tax=Streptomyces laculatispora TaxID=887464 RepID=A0ABY9I5J2_9ACTN|nr:hypothetical protein [Streptomyces laculatispora]WLQ42157.1 hypothetical protein P8A22_20665 [Streptomyces laculatispora]